MVLRGDVGIPVRMLVRDHIADVSFQSLSSCAPTWFPRPLPRVFRERWGGVLYVFREPLRGRPCRLHSCQIPSKETSG